VARDLGVTYWVLYFLIRSCKIPPPPKDEIGEYVWSPDDVARAREALKTVLKVGPRPKGVLRA
jgi:hypothetical protein